MVLPFKSKYCFGTVVAIRVPIPAAGITAQKRHG
jgi:hypothetical protein